jgi:hypothetical protein
MTRTDVAARADATHDAPLAPPHPAHPRVPSYGGGGELHLALALPSIAVAWSSSCDARAGDDGGLGKVQALANDGAIMRAVVGLLTACDVSYLCVNV